MINEMQVWMNVVMDGMELVCDLKMLYYSNNAIHHEELENDELVILPLFLETVTKTYLLSLYHHFDHSTGK